MASKILKSEVITTSLYDTNSINKIIENLRFNSTYKDFMKEFTADEIIELKKYALFKLYSRVGSTKLIEGEQFSIFTFERKVRKNELLNNGERSTEDCTQEYTISLYHSVVKQAVSSVNAKYTLRGFLKSLSADKIFIDEFNNLSKVSEQCRNEKDMLAMYEKSKVFDQPPLYKKFKGKVSEAYKKSHYFLDFIDKSIIPLPSEIERILDDHIRDSKRLR
jgi:hypothetical protein